mmetsp:Transcript_38182/g.119159  ORF Transcript_38182/g.119159 Transcript_38182/m.119159 type:complete len:355 (+) Transcript_38182:52-1116(+)
MAADATEASSNREWVFKSRPGPSGFAATDFELRACAVPEVAAGELLLRLHLLSMDPTMRNAMAGPGSAKRTDGSKYYSFMNWEPSTVPNWRVVAQVVRSRAEGFAEGDMVSATAPWRELVVLPGSSVEKVPDGITPSAALSAIGMTARTGYLGAKFCGEPKDGDVAFVSGAAGATGLTACQTLKNLGCRVVGSAGTDEKVEVLKSMGIEGFNYKRESIFEGLQRLCPGGVNVAFDNVGGETLEAILEMMNDEGRVVLCGAISQYDKPLEQRYGVRNLFHVVAKRLKLQGFVVLWSFSDEQNADCKQTLQTWFREGKIKDLSTFVDGFENLPEGILSLFSGANTGKCLVRVPLSV